MDARSYFIESEAEATSSMDYDDDCEEITPEEWEDAFQQAERDRAVNGMVAARSPALSDDEQHAPAAAAAAASTPLRVERAHSRMGQLARAAAAASPIQTPAPLGEVPLYPPGLADLPESDRKETTRVVFTINNPGEERPIFNEEKMAYLVWQLERGANGTLHIQGYCRFNKKYRLRTVIPLFGGRAHVLIARGNEQQCRDYCTKEDTRVSAGEEHGVFNPKAGMGKGHRSDLDEIAAKCAAGVPLQTIIAAHATSALRYIQNIVSVHAWVAPEPPAQREITVQVLWGPSGTGKTHRVLMNSTLRNTGGIFVVRPGRDPWGRYMGQATILFDEFDWRKWEIYEMNQYLDKWTTELDSRYHNKSAVWTRVIICANSSPTTWYANQEMELLLAFRRRLGHGCRHIVSQEQDADTSPASPDFDPLNGRDILLLHPRAQAPSSATSANAPQAAAAPPPPPFRVNGGAPPPDWIVCPDSQPPSPTQMQ